MKKFISIFSVIMCAVMFATAFAACKPKDIKDWENNQINDDGNPYYKDYYQVFIYGFADSNGDGVGDLKGVEQKLDYIADLGFTGIWLSPIHPSPTAHKYDVTDYMDVDEDFGTLADFESLVTAAHAKGISVMLDMVFNHTSNHHPWFEAAQKSFSENTQSKYRNYYMFTDSQGSSYETFGGYSHMPKLNLDNSDVRAEIDAICKFWLQDYDVDGFRLDAALHYYGNASQNVAFMQWLMSTARKYNENVYMVGEVWDNANSVYAHYAENSVQSFFNFATSTADGGNQIPAIVGDTVTDKAGELKTVVEAKENGTAKGIDALFASNHDTLRVSNSAALGYVSRRTNEFETSRFERHKMGIALLYTQAGNVFNYYGNEIGMRSGLRMSTSDDYLDHTYRTAMDWGNDCEISHENGFAYKSYGNSTLYGEYDDYLGGVAEQVNDQNSLYNFYRRIMLLRRQNPEIARGKSTFVAYNDSDVALIVRTYNGKSVLLAYNLNSSESKTVNIAQIISDNNLQGVLAGFLSSDNGRDVKLSNTTLKLPQFSMAVVR